MKAILGLWKRSGTKVLGWAQVTMGVLSTATDLFPPTWLKYMVVISGLLTAWRGYVNSAAGR